MANHVPTSRGRTWIGAACLLLAGVLPAQDVPLVLTTPVPRDGLSPAAVQARIDALDALKEASVRKGLATTYAEALAFARAGVDAKSRLNRAEDLRANGRSRIEAAREPLAPLAGPDRPSSLDTEEIARRLRAAQARASSLAATLAELGSELAAHQQRTKDLPGLVAKAERDVREAEAAWNALPAPVPGSVTDAANRTLAQARLAAAGAEHDALRAELQTITLAVELATARRERTTAESTRVAELVRTLQDLLDQRRQDAAERQVARAREALDALPDEPESLRTAAQETLDSARRRVETRLELGRLRARIETVTREHTETKKRFESLRQMVAHAGLTQTTGDLLRQYRSRLPDVTRFRVNSRTRQNASGDTRVRLIQLAEQIATTEEAFVQAAVEAAVEAADESARARVEQSARVVYRDRRAVLRELQNDYDAKLAELARLETEELLLTRLSGDFEAFIDEKVLWVRSTDPLWAADFARLPRVLQGLPGIGDLAAATLAGLGSQQPLVGILFVVAVVLLLSRRRLRAYAKRAGEEAVQGSSVAFLPTIASLFADLLLAAPIPVLAWLLATVCQSLGFVTVAGTGPAEAFRITAWVALVLGFFRGVCRKNGIAVDHMGWHATTAARWRTVFFWLLCFGLPAVFVTLTADPAGPYARSLVGRPVFMIGWLFVAGLFAARARTGTEGTEPGRRSMRGALWAVGVLLPLGLVGLAGTGYYFAAKVLGARLLWTFGVLFGLAVLSGTVNRWQLVSRRRLAFQQRRERLEAARLASANAESPATPGTDERTNVAEVSAQARRLAVAAFAIVGLVILYGIWVDVTPALRGLREFDVWSTTQSVLGPAAEDGSATTIVKSVPISLADLLHCLLVIVMTVVAARNVPGLLKLSVLQRVRPGNQYAIATLVQYGITIVGVVLAFGAIGIGWSKVQWLVAAVSLGLGFGLQEIFANFVSGLIILFERPIRVGDFVTVGAVKGEVTRIRIRATTIRNLERQELIVPNKEFITGQVINWTLTDTIVRIKIEVGIAYGSDVQLAQETLLRLATENKYVIDEPKPKALFTQFGESSLNFELRIYIRDLDHWPKTIDSMHQAIDREFRAAGIEIAFPQRDLHVRSVDGPFPVDLAREQADE